MDLKICIFFLLTVLVTALYHVRANKMCDWPRGTCTYKYDPCPPDWERCPQYDYDCPVKTNHCCCRRKRDPELTQRGLPPKPQNNVCDWPIGTCTYIHDPCPPDWHRCPDYDRGCKLATNHCCCRDNPPPKPTSPTPPKPQPNVCDWPRGTCTYIHDPCPPDWHRCPDYDRGCKVATNHCCCRDNPPTISDEPVKCDWPKGFCNYKKMPCPEGMEHCSQNDKGCTKETNHCCCYTNKKTEDAPKFEVQAKPCDWPYGTCTYVNDPCPPTWKRCSELDSGCKVPTNHCCCRTTPTPPPGKCDYPRGFCTYFKDPCPSNMERCPNYDIDCKLRTNHCCCHK